jgi:predicted nucleic acid-binding protein
VIVLDTTVLVYSKGSDHALRDPCRQLISAIADGQLQATTTVEVIQEFAHVRAQRRGRADAAALAAGYAEMLAPLLTVTNDDLGVGLSIFAREARLGAVDAVLAAAALASGASAIVSADMAFSDVSELPHVFPDANGIAALLRA